MHFRLLPIGLLVFFGVLILCDVLAVWVFSGGLSILLGLLYYWGS